MPLASKAGLLIGVDDVPDMLDAFLEQARRLDVEARTVRGRWPAVAGQTPVADVAVCHHVAYNAPDLSGFALALTEHAVARVVMEMTTEHPMSRLSPLWLRFHGVTRPTRPTAMDAVTVLREAGLDVNWQQWEAPRPGGFRRSEDLVAWVRRLICLPRERDPAIAEALAADIVEDGGLYGLPDRPVVTIWWPGTAHR
jgi:hypothetical protein